MNEDQHAGPGLVTDEKTYLVMENNYCNIFLGGNDFGLRVYIVQRMYKVIMQLRNISVYQNRNSAIDIRLNEMCNSNITIENLTITESRDSVIVLHSIIVQNVTIENCTGDREYFELCLMVSKLFIKGSFTFRRNRGGVSIFTCAIRNSQGGYVELSTGGKVLIEDNTIPSNTYGGLAVNVMSSRITLFGGSSLILNGNAGLKSGGLLLRNSTIKFRDKGEVIYCMFSHNRGSSGGSLAFYDRSVMRFYGNGTLMYFIRNHATIYMEVPFM